MPGKILSIAGDDPLTRTGKVSFGGVVKEVNLAYTPEAEAGSYVIVHAGFAISVLDEEQARKVLDDLRAIEALAKAECSDEVSG